MKRNSIVVVLWALVAWAAAGCGVSSDGGQSGTGISLIRGNVVAVTGADPDVADITVSLVATNLTTLTDAGGRFELRGNASGQAELRFMRQRDALLATTQVVIPAGGVLDLEEIEIDGNTGEVRPARQRVEFEGSVGTLDCAGGTILLVPKDDDPQATVFTVDVATATIRDDDGAVLTCADLRLGDRLQVRSETVDGSTLINAELVLSPGEENQNVQFEGIVEALDCAGGSIRLIPKDDDPTATAFIVDVASATIRDGDVMLMCGDLHIGDRLQLTAETSDGTTLVNAELVLSQGEEN